MSRDPAWLMFACRRKPGWERRSRVRCGVAVVVCMVLTCTGSQQWAGAEWKVHGVTRTGAHEWTLEVSYWPEWERVAVMVSSRETALRLEHRLWTP